MSQPDPTTQTGLAANELEMTDAERAALNPEEDKGGDGTAPPAVDKPLEEGTAGAPAAPAPPATEATPAAPAATDLPVEGAPPQAPAAAAPPPAPTPFHLQLPSTDRNFDTELADVNTKLKELKATYAGGSAEMSDDAYEAEFERLQDLKGDIRTASAIAQHSAQLNQQSQDASWEYLQRQFLADQSNSGLTANRILFSAWEAGMQEAVNDAAAQGKTLTDWDVMVQGRQKLVDAGLLAGAAPAVPDTTAPPAVTPPPKPDRTPPLKDVPTTLSGLPSAADVGSRSTAEELAGSDIEDIETRWANMSEAQRDQILRGVPGTVVG